MTAKPKARKAPAAKAGVIPDPIFAAIAEHKALIREAHRLRGKFMAARALAEEKYGKWGFHWPGEAKAIDRPPYDRWVRASRAARTAGKRLARMNPSTLAGVAALVQCARRDIMENENDGEFSDWGTTALKTVAGALIRMSEEASQ